MQINILKCVFNCHKKALLKKTHIGPRKSNTFGNARARVGQWVNEDNWELSWENLHSVRNVTSNVEVGLNMSDRHHPLCSPGINGV